MNWKLRCFCLLAALTVTPSMGAVSSLNCPLTCSAGQAGFSGGVDIGPPGTNLSVSFGPRVDGLGMQDPCGACPGSPCKLGVTIVWNNNGTGDLLEWDYGGISSGPLTQFNRGG